MNTINPKKGKSKDRDTSKRKARNEFLDPPESSLRYLWIFLKHLLKLQIGLFQTIFVFL